MAKKSITIIGTCTHKYYLSGVKNVSKTAIFHLAKVRKLCIHFSRQEYLGLILVTNASNIKLTNTRTADLSIRSLTSDYSLYDNNVSGPDS